MILEYDNVVLGSSLKAILFAAQNFFPVVFSDFRPPFRFDHLDPELDLKYLKLPPELRSKNLTTFDKAVEVGVPKYILWEHLIFLLSAGGYVPLSNLCRSIRADNNLLTCFNEYSKIAEIRFNTCYYFHDTGVNGLFEQKLLEKQNYICYDWIAFNKGGKHDIDFFETSSDFVKRIWFYPSDRIDGNTSVKDACVLSILAEEQLQDFAYSETMAKFKLISEMENRGMKGQFNGYSTNGNPKHYKFRSTHIRREKYAKTKDSPFKVAGFKIKQVSEKELQQDLQSIYMGHDRFLRA